MQQSLWQKYSSRWKDVSFPTLLFFLLFPIDAVWIKPIALLAGMIPVRKILLSKGAVKGFPVLYWALPLVGLLQLLLFSRDFSGTHLISTAIGILFWLAAGAIFLTLAAHLKKMGQSSMLRTLDAWLIINAMISLAQLLLVMQRDGHINPYVSHNVLYGASTGDYIKGIFLGPSYLNMMVNSALAVHYISRSKHGYALIATTVAVATGSNFAVPLLALILVIAALAKGLRRGLPIVAAHFAIIAIFYFGVSSTNFRHGVGNDTEIPFSTDSISKISSFRSTIGYLQSGWQPAIAGAGIGDFSSQLAVRRSDLVQNGHRSRLFARLPVYISEAFRTHHYKMFKAIFASDNGFHSIRYLPSSGLNQIGGEYGILGLLLFFGYCFRLVYRDYRNPLCWLLLALLLWFTAADYLFEYLSAVPFIELIFLLNYRNANALPE